MGDAILPHLHSIFCYDSCLLQVLQRFEAAEKVVEEKALELKEIADEYEKARALEDKIRVVEVDIANQLEDYAKVCWDSELYLYCTVLYCRV